MTGPGGLLVGAAEPRQSFSRTTPKPGFPKTGRRGRMHMRSGRRGRGAWWGAVAIGGSIALVLSGAPLSAQASSLAAETIVCPGVADRLPEIPASAQDEV